MEDEKLSENSYDEDFDLNQFFRVIWEGKVLILYISILFGILTAIISFQINDYYSSQALLIPEEEESSIGQNFSSIASLAGVNIGDGTANRTKEALAVLNSRKFIVDFIQKYKLNMPILAAKGWDPVNDKILYDYSVLGGSEIVWKNDEYLEESYKRFTSDHYSVSEDILGSGLITIRVQFMSPTLSRDWVNIIVEEINNYFKEKDIEEASKSLAYLESELRKQNLNLDLKKVLYDLIQEQTSILVLANGKDEYIFRTVDPAYKSEKKAGPMRSIYVTLAFLAGMMMAIFILFLAFYNNYKLEIIKRFPLIRITKT